MASQDLPNTTNPDDWAKIAGRKGERIVHVKSLPRGTEKSRSVDTVVAIGQYL
jgi:proteasome-associated ATPase